MSAVNATRRLGMSDHSWVHIQIVLNIGLRLARLLFRRGVVPSVVADYGMTERDAEVVVAAACLMHCVGMSIHREDHERYSLFLTADKLGTLLAAVYEEPERSIIAAEALHAIIGHRRPGHPFTVEAGIVRVADALDMARGRSRIPFESGHQNIHSLSAYAIEEVKISPGAIAPSGSRSRCPTAPASSRSTSCWREAARLGPGGAHRGDRPDRRRARAAADPGVPDLSWSSHRGRDATPDPACRPGVPDLAEVLSKLGFHAGVGTCHMHTLSDRCAPPRGLSHAGWRAALRRVARSDRRSIEQRCGYHRWP